MRGDDEDDEDVYRFEAKGENGADKVLAVNVGQQKIDIYDVKVWLFTFTHVIIITHHYVIVSRSCLSSHVTHNTSSSHVIIVFTHHTGSVPSHFHCYVTPRTAEVRR